MIYQKEIIFKDHNVSLTNTKKISDAGIIIDDVQKTVDFLNKHYKANCLVREYLFVVGYDEANCMESLFVASIGNELTVPQYNKQIAIYMLLSYSCKFRLFHNHPKIGTLGASEADKNTSLLTMGLCHTIDVKYLGDYIICGDEWLGVDIGIDFENV